MAKRKSKKNNTKMMLVAGALLLAILGVVLFFVLDAVQFVVGDEAVKDATFTGANVIFGYSKTVDLVIANTKPIEILKFSFMALVPVLLTLGGAVLALLGLNNKLLSFIGGALFIASAVFFFVVPNFVVVTEAGTKALAGLAQLTGIESGFKALAGIYLAASFTGVSGLLTIGSAL